MFFIALTFLAALLIEGLGTLVSVIGLSTLFGANPIIIALAIALDLGKIVVVTLLYTYWRQLNKLMKSYALVAAAVTMVITSAGAAGYLSGEFQKAIIGTQEGQLKVQVLKDQIAKYEERKKQIDVQIAALPEKTTVNQRIRLINAFKQEQKDLQDKIGAIDKQLPELQIAQIGVEAKAGPILYISKAFDVSVEEAVKWVILLIIFVFDPLAVFLIIAGNFLLHQRKMHKDAKVSDADLFEEDSLQKRIEVAKEVFSGSNASALSAIKDDEAQREFEKPAEPFFELLKPTVEFAAPDASQAKVYTRDDLIKEGVSDEQLIDAGYEPRGGVVQPAVSFREPSPEREQITLSSLGIVKEDPHTDAGDHKMPTGVAPGGSINRN